MLEEIRISQLGVIDSSTLELGPGLTVITGETLAGGPPEVVRRVPNVDHRHGDGTAEIIGIAIYDDYREVVKRDLFLDAPTAGLLFETKEHIAWAVLVLTLGAGAVAALAPREAKQLRRSAALMYAVAAGICSLTVVLGTYVAAVRGFPM